MQIRPRQRWRDTSKRGGAIVITVDDVSGTTVNGSYAPEDAPGVVGTGAWSVDDVHRMTLVHDPEWPTHRVVMKTTYDLYGDGPVDRAMAPVGLKAGARSMEPQPDGSSSAVAWWDVVAPDEDEAVRRVREAVAHIDATKVDAESIHVNNRAGR